MCEKEIPDDEKLKKELTDKFDKSKTYLGAHVRSTIQQTSFKLLREYPVIKPNTLKKGDVFLGYEGVKRRPNVVCKVLKDKTVIYIPLTSSDNVHCLTPSKHKSRFFGEGCFSKAFSVADEEFALENFVGVFDNDKALNKAIKALKEYINTNL